MIPIVREFKEKLEKVFKNNILYVYKLLYHIYKKSCSGSVQLVWVLSYLGWFEFGSKLANG